MWTAPSFCRRRVEWARHGVLRTSFHWEEASRPLQLVHREARLRWVEEDWRGMPAAEERARLEAGLTTEELLTALREQRARYVTERYGDDASE